MPKSPPRLLIIVKYVKTHFSQKYFANQRDGFDGVLFVI